MSMTQCFEVRLYGLHQSITSTDLSNFFSNGIRVLGVLVHPNPPPLDGYHTQWAQVWTGSEEEVIRCLTLKDALKEKGITISRPSVDSLDMLGQLKKPSFPSNTYPPSSPVDLLFRPSSSLGFQHNIPAPLPRNLYILGVPIDLTQQQFKALFLPYGQVEHSTLLSQLDGLGRRRGFILMSTNREAVQAMTAMNGRWLDGFKVDVSWALVQREARQFANHGGLPNRVIHPPAILTRRSPPPECSVFVDNLDPVSCPNAGAIREIFSHFGRVERVTVLPGPPLQAIVAFEHPISATALINSNGMNFGNLILHTRSLVPRVQQAIKFDPFQDEALKKLNPETQAFIPSDRTTTDLGSSPSGRGSSGVSKRSFCEQREKDLKRD